MPARPGRRERPNFILFVTDQHRADYLGCYGHPVLKTPHIDAIARRGTRFERFYVSSPQCMPNRATLMTGRMPSVHGVRTNGIPLSLRANTFVDLLRTQDYRTALVGKCHLQNMLDHTPDRTPAVVEKRRKSGRSDYAEAMRPVLGDDYDQERTARWRLYGHARAPQRYYGFEQVELCTLHGDAVGAAYDHWLRARHHAADRLRGRANQLPHDYTCPQAWRTAVPESLYPTTFIAEKAVEYLASHDARANDRPFFLMVSFPDPHHPFTPPGRYWNMYRPEDMKLPASFSSGHEPTPHLKQVRANSRQGGNEYHAMAVSGREAQEAMALTCGMVAMIDDAVGAVMAQLDKSGLADSTIVMFTSDHGDLLGDHGLILKGPFHYRSLVRVPFVWADPFAQSPPASSKALAGTIDIAATVLARAGVDPYHGMQGRSLLPLLDGVSGGWRNMFMIEEEQHAGVLGYDEPLRVRSLLTQRYRMTIYTGADWGEIYDLEDDPHELVNLWSSHNAREIRRELMEGLAYSQMALVDPNPLPSRLG